MGRSLTQAQWKKYSKRCDDRRAQQLQDSFNQGKAARREGKTLADNPMQSYAWRTMWIRGWEKGGED